MAGGQNGTGPVEPPSIAGNGKQQSCGDTGLPGTELARSAAPATALAHVRVSTPLLSETRTEASRQMATAAQGAGEATAGGEQAPAGGRRGHRREGTEAAKTCGSEFHLSV